MAFDFLDFLKRAAASKASDVHLRVGEHPAIRVDGKIIKANMPLLTEEDMQQACQISVPERLKHELASACDLDYAYEIPGLSRFRVNMLKSVDKTGFVIRLIPTEIKALADLNLPDVVESLTQEHNGLILVTGATGSGKSTTISALIDTININYPKHILTIEDPMEFVFKNKKSVVSQRQVGLDVPTFKDGIKYALRQDPDVIFIGEIRDQDTINSALKAAETGHLVFATIHTNSAVATVNRIVNMFEPSNRDFVRLQLAGVLRGTISQRLVPLAEGKGRQAACEVLISTPAVKDYIEKDKLDDIYSLAKGSSTSMLTMNQTLFNLAQAGRITQEAAVGSSDNPSELERMFRGIY